MEKNRPRLAKISAILIFCHLFALSHLATSQKIDYKGLPQWSQHQEGITNYWLYTPDNLQEGQVYPVALFLHGCCPEDEVLLPRNIVDPPLRMWHHFGDNEQTIPTYIVAPVSKRGWGQHIDNLKKVMDDLVANQQGDAQRIYITGFSMGGGGTWQFLNQYPDYFAAAMPMGSGIRGDIDKLKDIPIWINIGENDGAAPALKDSVAVFRKANGDPRGALEWETGVNPRYTEFDGVGHGVQWDAVSTQDLLSWAYDKVNDGNACPVVYFKSPEYGQTIPAGESVPFELFVDDHDSEIDHVEIYVNDKLFQTLKQPPYSGRVDIKNGNNILSAKAFDQQGKSSSASIAIKTDISALFITRKLPVARQAAFFTFQLLAKGNSEKTFILSPESNPLPDGISLSSSGQLSGIPNTAGKFNFSIIVTDAEGDKAEKNYRLHIKNKYKNDVVVSNVSSLTGQLYSVSRFSKGVLPFSGKNSEINISKTAGYDGYTFIQTAHSDRDSSDSDFLTFDVDEDVLVTIAYEKCDHLYESTVPDWLNDFKKEPGQIEAQYFYFDMYIKPFQKGRITLPGADASRNNANNNYFVLIKKNSL